MNILLHDSNEIEQMREGKAESPTHIPSYHPRHPSYHGRSRVRPKSTSDIIDTDEPQEDPDTNVSFPNFHGEPNTLDTSKASFPNFFPKDAKKQEIKIRPLPESTTSMKDIAKTSALHSYTKDETDLPEGYQEDPDLSNEYVSVLVNPDKKHVVTAYRGTNPADKHDLFSDALILTGSLGFDYTSGTINWANHTFEKVKTKYPDHEHLISGHSLGGYISSTVSKKFNVDSITFNEGFGFGALSQSLSYQIDKAFHPERYTSKHISYNNLVDPISVLGHLNFDTDKRWFFDVKHIHSLPKILKS